MNVALMATVRRRGLRLWRICWPAIVDEARTRILPYPILVYMENLYRDRERHCRIMTVRPSATCRQQPVLPGCGRRGASELASLRGLN